MVREDEVEEAIAFIKKNADIKIFDDLVIPLEFKVGRNWCDMEEIKDLRDLKEIEEIKNVGEPQCAN